MSTPDVPDRSDPQAELEQRVARYRSAWESQPTQGHRPERTPFLDGLPADTHAALVARLDEIDESYTSRSPVNPQDDSGTTKDTTPLSQSGTIEFAPPKEEQRGESNPSCAPTLPPEQSVVDLDDDAHNQRNDSPTIDVVPASPDAKDDDRATIDHRSSDDGKVALTGEDALISDREAIPGYEIQGELGRGGMGVVYKARQKGLKRTVALKMLLAGTHASHEQISRFEAEAEAIARLQHPNIVQIYDVGKQGGLSFFSLEFVDGLSPVGTTGRPAAVGAAVRAIDRNPRAGNA